MLRSLILQLACHASVIPKALIELYGKGQEEPSISSLESALQRIIDDFDHVYIVLDALDESTEKVKIFHWIERVSQLHQGKLHLLFSSRDEPDIDKGTKALINLQHITFSEDVNEDDIESYVAAKLSQTSWGEETRELIETTLTSRACGMYVGVCSPSYTTTNTISRFRWVDLQLQELSKCLNIREVKRCLRELPKGLEEAYERLLLRSSRRNDLKTLLQFLAFSIRPLTAVELAETITVDMSRSDVPMYDPELRYTEACQVLNVCSGFVTIFNGTFLFPKKYLFLFIHFCFWHRCCDVGTHVGQRFSCFRKSQGRSRQLFLHQRGSRTFVDLQDMHCVSASIRDDGVIGLDRWYYICSSPVRGPALARTP